MSIDPYDPFAAYKVWATAATRTVEQMQEARRQAKLTAARADIDTAYLMFRNTSDRESAENLQAAVAAFLTVA